MASNDFKNVKISTLVSIVVYGANALGMQLVRQLSEQGSKVIVIDSYTRNKKKIIQDLKKLKDVEFVDFQGAEELVGTLKRYDYLFYLQSQYLQSEGDYKSKDFLHESNNLNLLLKSASKFNAKVSLITSLQLNKSLNEALAGASPNQPTPYSPEEIQKYAETVTAEYHDKSGLNVRILRLGTVLGHNDIPIDDTSLDLLLQNSVDKGQLEIVGEGLDNHFLINTEDAVYGILRMTFTPKTAGEVVTLANNREYTTLSIAYKLLELNPTAQTIKFLPASADEPLLTSPYIPAPNAENFGWKQKINLEQSLSEDLDKRYSHSGQKWSNRPEMEYTVEKPNKKNVTQEKKREKKQPFWRKSKKETSTTTLDKVKPKTEETPKPVQQIKKEDKELTPTRVKTSAMTVKTPLGKVIDAVFTPIRNFVTKIINTPKEIKDGMDRGEKLRLGGVLLAIIALFYFLIGPIISLGIGGYFMYTEAKAAYAQVSEFNFTESEAHFNKFLLYFERSERSIQKLEWAFTVTGQHELYNNVTKTVYGLQYGVEGARDLTIALDPLAQYAESFDPAISIDETTPSTTRQYREELNALRDNRDLISNATYKISLATDVIQDVDVSEFPAKLQPYVLEAKENNQLVAEMLEPFEKTVTFLPELLGVDERQRYLVLLQNPSEIRSTGGWLSSYAVVGIESGQILQLDVDDIYNIEGLLSVQGKFYEAPQDMQNALEIDNWSFSLVNWSPNLSDVATDAEFFLRESGRALSIDGVVTLDTSLIQSLLDYWGGIQVPGEDEIITSDNLHEKIFEIHNEFTPGSRRKTTFLANLANEVLQKVLTSDATGYADVSSILYNSLEEKHILVYISNEEANRFFDSEGWSGHIAQKNTGTPATIEWNWGANKSNLFLERNVDLTMEMQDIDNIKYSYSLAIKNLSQVNTYPQGDYVNYVRMYLPEDAQITATRGFDSNQYDIELRDGYKVLGGWFTTQIHSTNKLEVDYNLARTDDSQYFPISTEGNNIILDLDIFKQPGLDGDDYNLEIIYPDTWAVSDQADFSKAINLLSKQFVQKTDTPVYLQWVFK